MSFFAGSSRAKVEGGTFINVAESSNPNVNIVNNLSTRLGSGFDRLEAVTLHEALRDSSVREVPRCFEGTRIEHRRNITSWGKGEWGSHSACVLWMDGPAGVGKSALAQTLAEEDLNDKFAAGFFFSRANGWNHPAKLLPTIAYQLATKYSSYRDAVDTIIIRDPFVLKKSIKAQFEELVVKPLQGMNSEDRAAIENAIIFIDGLDECGPLSDKFDHVETQQMIIDVITTSAAASATPFLWGFFTRPEPHIIAAFSLNHAPEVTWHLTLPLRAPNVDKDIEAYFRDGFRTVRAKHPSLSSSWPSEDSLTQLVSQSNGLFIYGTSAIRFIEGGPRSRQVGPEERLQCLLDSMTGARTQLSKLDQLYFLIMDQVPKDILPDTLLILCANQHSLMSFYNRDIATIPILSSLLGFSQTAFDTALNPLSAVLQLVSWPSGQFRSGHLTFYHASFTDFLVTSQRSTSEYCINTRDVCTRLFSASLSTASPLLPIAVAGRVDSEPYSEEELRLAVYQAAIERLIDYPKLTGCLQLRDEPAILKQLTSLDWKSAVKYNTLQPMHGFGMGEVEAFVEQIPTEWRPLIIMPYRESFFSKIKRKVFGGNSKKKVGYVLGTGANRAFLEIMDGYYTYQLREYPPKV